MQDYRYIWDYTTDFKNLERNFNINKVTKVDLKIKFCKNRLIKFKKWECKSELNILRNAAIDKLNAQLEFLTHMKNFKLKKLAIKRSNT